MNLQKFEKLSAVFLVAQLLGVMHLIYQYKFANAHVPVAFIELHLFVFITVFASIFVWYLFYKKEFQNKFWRLVILITILSIVLFLICYAVMGMEKYSMHEFLRIDYFLVSNFSFKI